MKKFGNYSALFGVALLSTTYMPSLLAQNADPTSQQRDFRILRHESLNDIRFIAQQAAVASGSSAAASQLAAITLPIKAFGKQFMLELQANDRLFENLPLAQKHRLKQSMQLYKGRIANVGGSWVRLSRANGRISGAFWDGKELYIIDNAEQIGKALVGSVAAKAATSQNAPIIYRMSDTESKASCAITPKVGALNNFQGLVSELQTQAKAAQATRKLDVAIVTDAEFNQANANPQAVVAARMNVVDGIFSEQVGVHINVSQISQLASDGAMTSTNPQILLDQFANYMQSPGANNPGLAHLFTGRDMDQNVVGIAYIGALCNKFYGVGASQVDATGVYGALTVAHEMGHNFGSPHDSQDGSACASTADTFLMNPVLNGSSQFSQCSLQQMVPNVSAASCVINIISASKADVRPVLPATSINTVKSGRFVYKVEVKNAGTGIATKAAATILVPTALTINSALVNVGRCTRAVGKVTCSLGTVPAGVTRTITMTLKAGTKAAKLVSTAQVSASNDSNATNNIGKVVINVK